MKKYIPLILIGTIILLFVLFPMPMLGTTIAFSIFIGMGLLGNALRKFFEKNMDNC